MPRSRAITRSPDSPSPSELLEEANDRLNPAIEIWDVEFFVGSVEVVVGKAEAHHHAGQLEDVLEVGDDRDRSSGANEDRIFLKDLVQGFGGGLDKTIVGVHHARRAFAMHLDADVDAFGRELL